LPGGGSMILGLRTKPLFEGYMVYLVFIRKRFFFLLAASICTIIRQRIKIRLLIID